MAKRYEQLSLRERVELYRLHKEGLSMRAVATALDRSPSTISRELRRNSENTKAWCAGYEPVRANSLAQRRRCWDARFKLARNEQLRTYVRQQLEIGWSPEQIAGALRREHGHCIISYEAIYRFVYHRSAQKDYWHRLLPRHKPRRGWFARRPSPAERIPYRISVRDRPAEAQTRRTPGHWEADLMLFRRYGQAILITHERASRVLIARRQPNKAARPVARQLLRQFQALPPSLRRTVTFDNGTEFTRHYELNQQLGMATYFCDTHAPWQKGGIENAIGRLRRPLPRKTDLVTLSVPQLNRLIAAYNNTPRKCLAFNTPARVFYEQVLHFKRECTFPLTRE
jgi:IS30 family transposase